MRTIVWFRDFDLRLGDHTPLRSAIDRGEVIPVFLLDDAALPLDSAHQTQFLLESVAGLERDLRAIGSPLVIVRGAASELLPRLLTRFAADRIVAHRSAFPLQRTSDTALRSSLGGRIQFFDTARLVPEGAVRTRQGTPFAVFTYFARAVRASVAIGRPLAAPQRLGTQVPAEVGAADALPRLEDLGHERNPRLAEGGELAAHRRLQRFVEEHLPNYVDERDRMDHDATSRLSVDLRFGTLSARQVWNAVRASGAPADAIERFCDQLLWREFAYSTLIDRPSVLDHPFRPEFEGFPWKHDEAAWRAWTEGRTGYPVVDAAARQLLGEGFVHNRARMAAASFLTKHLMIGYWQGEQHYMAHLVDADLAQNNLGWQWSAGCGCDAQPYFRVFNPVTQGTKFDPHGDYVRRWVPELAAMPTKFIHRPWEAPASTLMNAGVRLGVDYPEPIVEHRFARERFLTAAKRHLASTRAATG